MSEEEEEKDRKIVGINMDLFCFWWPDTKNILTQKELKIKMSSAMPFSFNAVELCVVTINEKPWTRAREFSGHLDMARPPRLLIL